MISPGAPSDEPRERHAVSRLASRPSSSSRLAAIAVGLFVASVALVALRTVLRFSGHAAPGVDAWGLQDFNDAIYQPVVALLEGENPYGSRFAETWPVRYPFPLYLPATLALHLPLGLLPLPVAGAVYFLLCVALVPVLARLALRMAGVARSATVVFGVSCLVVLSRPGSWTLFIGQYTVTMVVATYVALVFARERPWLAATGVALAALKPTFGAPLALLLLARGEWRPVVRGLAVAGALSLVVVVPLAQSAGGVGPFLESLAENYARFASMEQVSPALSAYRIDAAGLIGRVIGAPLAPALELLLVATVLGVAALGVRRLAADPEVEPAARLATALVTTATLLCTYHQGYDALLLAAPLVALSAGAWAPARLATPGRRALLLGLLGLPAVNYLCTNVVTTWLDLRGPSAVVNASANGAALVLAFALLARLVLRPLRAQVAARAPDELWTVQVTSEDDRPPQERRARSA